MEPYELAKASIDRFIQLAATAMGLEYVNLDSTDAQEKLDGPEELVIAKIMQFDDAPRAPLYDVEIIVGVKVHQDTNGYRLSELLKDLKKAFLLDSQVDVGDFGTYATPALDGYLVITRSTITGSNFEGLNLVQVLQVNFKGMIHAG